MFEGVEKWLARLMGGDEARVHFQDGKQIAGASASRDGLIKYGAAEKGVRTVVEVTPKGVQAIKDTGVVFCISSRAVGPDGEVVVANFESGAVRKKKAGKK